MFAFRGPDRLRDMRKRVKSIVDSGVLALTLVFAASCATGQAAAPPPAPATTTVAAEQVPLMVRNGLPVEQHQWLDALAGDWNVEMSFFLAGATPDKPHTGKNVVSHWRWLDKTGRKFIEETTEGTMLDKPYFRRGVLGYSIMDKQFQFSTFDQLNSMVMAYSGPGDQRQITMTGSFTDQGILGDASVGKTIGMRTRIRFETPDRNVFELYFTPPGQPEILIDRKVYTRVK